MSTERIERKLSGHAERVEAVQGTMTEKKMGGWQAIAGQAKHDGHFREATQLGEALRAKANAVGH